MGEKPGTLYRGGVAPKDGIVLRGISGVGFGETAECAAGVDTYERLAFNGNRAGRHNEMNLAKRR